LLTVALVNSDTVIVNNVPVIVNNVLDRVLTMRLTI
jgi:hypothetical protein